MKKFEILVNEIVNHQHRVIVEAESEEDVEDALNYADSQYVTCAYDYIYNLKDMLKVVDVEEECFVDIKEVEGEDFNEIN